MPEAAIILLQATFVPNISQPTGDLPQDLQIGEGRQISLLNSLKRKAAEALQA